jgi:V-type H(+)-translocating pyrophosphatase
MDLMFIVTLTALIALAFALFTAKRLSKSDPGGDDIRRISGIIRRAANAFLKRQYIGVGIFFAAVFILLLVLALCGAGNIYTPFAFLTGGLFSGLAGFIGMRIATSSNGRTVSACCKSLNAGLRTAFSSGTVMGMSVVGLGLLDVSLWYLGLKYLAGLDINQIASTMICFGMGASSMALFARVGGGIFTKAADVGADLCGKVEAGIPEDDVRNPAVIADNVGDNVGDVAGMGADLYESYVGSVLSASALGAFAGMDERGFIIPFLIAVAGVLASIIGTFFVRTGENASQRSLLSSLRRGVYAATGIMALASGAIIHLVLGTGNGDGTTVSPWGLYGSVLFGLAAGAIMGVITEYFTSDSYKPTKRLAKSSDTGSATVIIDGLALGMRSTLASVITVGAAIAGSYFLAGGAGNPSLGLYGVGIAAVGMLSTLGITLSTDAYGPVADNAGGIAEMTGQDPIVRKRTDALDSLGNTTAATGKGFAIGSAALTAITLIAAFRSTVMQLGYDFDLSILNPKVLIGLFVGVMLPFLFSAITMQAVGRAAGRIVTEVRRQFREIKGLMTGEAQPDYEACVDICTRSSQREMIFPALVAIIAPMLVGILLDFDGIAGMLAGAAASGFCLATMMSNSGGAWDNAKKYIESGEFGGKGSSNHKAAVVGDTVGDPFKDTSGPSINILIKLLSVVSIVLAPLIRVITLLLWH